MSSNHFLLQDKPLIDPEQPTTTYNEDSYAIPKSTARPGRIGKSIVFFWLRGEPLITIGPHWMFFLLSLVFIEGIGIVVYVAANFAPGSVLKYFFLASILLEGFVFGYTGLRNPGILMPMSQEDPGYAEASRKGNFCRRCQVLMDQDTYHCIDCDACIKGYDHHCPWTGKCIGANNVKSFYTFITVTVVYFVICFVVVFGNVLNKD